MSAARWERLRVTLAEQGVETKVDSKVFPGGTSYSIGIKTEAGYVGVIDQWWRKNDSIWIGYQVWLEDKDSIVIKNYPLTKKRSEVAAAVKAALATKVIR